MERHWAPGFSLLELLIALAIVAILTTITVPSYSGLLAKTRRGDAMASLLLVQLDQERWRSGHADYAAGLDELGWVSPVSKDGYYRLRIHGADSVSYRVVAEPVGVQRKDTCGDFAIDQNGPVYSPGYAGPPCWSR